MISAEELRFKMVEPLLLQAVMCGERSILISYKKYCDCIESLIHLGYKVKIFNDCFDSPTNIFIEW